MRVGAIGGLWRYPVKSMGGERLETAQLTLWGLPGDRGWAVYDEQRGGVTNAKRLPSLRGCHARYLFPPDPAAAPPPAEMTLPDGSVARTDDASAPALLTACLGRPVTLRGLGAPGADAAARVSAEGDPETDTRAILGVEPGEPLPDLSAFAPELMHEFRLATFFDAFPLHLLTSATLRTLAGRAPERSFDVRRFRPNVLVEQGATGGFPELDWIGRRLRLGTATVEVAAGCPRCVMVNQPVDGLPADPLILRTIVREAAHVAGVYARVVEPGEIRVGEPLVMV